MPKETLNEKIFLIIPTIRDLEFLNDWKNQIGNVSVIICEDKPKKTLKTPHVGKEVFHYSWKEIDKDLGKDSWIIPRKVSAIRNYGFLKAHQMKADIIISIDDDCLPVKNHNLIQDHSRNLSLKTSNNWMSSYPDVRHMFTRGYPYLIREEQSVMLSHGLWTNILDHDGPTHLQHLSFRAEFAEHFIQVIPHHMFFPMCSMNFAFRREITPLMYFPLMGEDRKGNKWGYDRFDDIWCGVIAKKVLDHIGYAVVNGSPFVEHRKASNPFKNLQKEAKGIELNEEIWQEIQKIKLTESDIISCLKELIQKLDISDKEYLKKLKNAYTTWLKQF